MNNYNYDDEIREERLAREIGRKFAELGFGTVQTDEEYEKSKKNFKKKHVVTCKKNKYYNYFSY